MYNYISTVYYYSCYSPIDTKLIRKQIFEGSVQSISDVQILFMVLAYNAIMINSSHTIVFSDASNFQEKLMSNIDVGSIL